MKRNGKQRFERYRKRRSVRPFFRIISTLPRPTIETQRIARAMEAITNYKYTEMQAEYDKQLENLLIYGTTHPKHYFATKDEMTHFSEINDPTTWAVK